MSLNNPELAIIAGKLPSARICLISALALHDMTNEIPHKIQIALSRSQRNPQLVYPPVQVYRFSGESLTEGVEGTSINGVKIQVYNPAKTIADCFKFRNQKKLPMRHRIDSSSINQAEMEALVSIIQSGGRPALVDAEGNRTELPEALYKMLVHIVQQMKRGQSVVLLPEDETFTTQAAANFLGMSRQHLINLLEKDHIPYHMVGSHRRIYFRDLTAYADQRDKARRKTLDNLFDKVDKADKYDTSYTGDER